MKTRIRVLSVVVLMALQGLGSTRAFGAAIVSVCYVAITDGSVREPVPDPVTLDGLGSVIVGQSNRSNNFPAAVAFARAVSNHLNGGETLEAHIDGSAYSRPLTADDYARFPGTQSLAEQAAASATISMPLRFVGISTLAYPTAPSGAAAVTFRVGAVGSLTVIPGAGKGSNVDLTWHGLPNVNTGVVLGRVSLVLEPTTPSSVSFSTTATSPEVSFQFDSGFEFGFQLYSQVQPDDFPQPNIYNHQPGSGSFSADVAYTGMTVTDTLGNVIDPSRYLVEDATTSVNNPLYLSPVATVAPEPGALALLGAAAMAALGSRRRSTEMGKKPGLGLMPRI